MTESGSQNPSLPPRLEKLTLGNFRGWGTEQTLNLDADVVLITAANGRGKSSVIEALSIGLNGVSIHHDSDNLRIHHDSDNLGVGSSVDAQPVITLEPKFQAGGDRDQLPPAVLRRATVFLQDRLAEQFERGEDKGVLLGFLAPTPDWLTAYDTALADQQKQWQSLRPDERDRPPAMTEVEAANRRYETAITAFAKELAVEPGASPKETLAAAFARVLGRGEADPEIPGIWDGVRRALDRDRTGISAERRALWEAREEASRNLDEHCRQWPNLEALAGWWAAADQPGGADLDAVFATLATLAGRKPHWLRLEMLRKEIERLPADSRDQAPVIDEAIQGLAEEFQKVDAARAGRYRDALRNWRDFWKGRMAERRSLDKALEEARRALERLEAEGRRNRALDAFEILRQARQVVKALKNRERAWQARKKRWEQVQPLLEAVRHQRDMLKALQQGQLAERVRDTVGTVMNAVMAHFIVAGLTDGERIRLEDAMAESQVMRPQLADGRTLEGHMSTGQQAQTAFAWMLSTNALLQRWLPHRLLLLDDLSTALDLTNLAAECALLRKFAYTKDPLRKRQVVITSHHDQLTSRLFDLLVPPKGFSMIEMRLGEWDATNGPAVEVSQIRATGRESDETRKMLGGRLDDPFKVTAEAG